MNLNDDFKLKVSDQVNKVVDISQMSQWTGWTAEGTTGARQFAQINGRLLHKDKEELASELNGLKIQNNIQQEEIKLLKTEIGKLKKRGGVYLPSAKVQASHA